MNVLLPLLLGGCGSPTPPSPWPVVSEPEPPPAPAASVSLADLRTPTELELPPSTRPGGADAPETFPAPGTWRRGASGEGWQAWTIPLPVDFHLFLQRQAGARTFGFYAPEGLEVLADGRPLTFERNAKGAGTWGYDRERLMVGLADGAGAPEGITLRWAKATAAERALHLATSGRSPVDFALRGVAQGTESYTGALLPAPARVAWQVEVPEGAVFAARTWLLPPSIRTEAASDGATLRVEVEEGGVVRTLLTQAVGREAVRLRAPVGAAGPAVVRLVVEPGATADHDLVFVEDPTIYVPSPAPQRVVLAFVDTVRHDHLGMYGYARPTTPRLDAWAAGATRFDQARTVSPWTLPSALATLSGRQPEAWDAGPTLAERLSAVGFRTRAIVANAYLSQVFGADRGFDAYTYSILQPAARTVDQALEELEAWPDRDLFLLVQFMEAHLPYEEPPAYRHLFTGDKPDTLKSVSRNDLVRYQGDEPDFAAVRDHVVGRYDQNLRVLDDEVGRLFEAVGPAATTVLFSDHGEEFWDHRGFEHGHSFHDELLHVPLVVRSPSLRAAAESLPVSLLDVAPTVLDLVGAPLDGPFDGRPLRAAVHGDDGAREALASRPQGFGRPLYGDDGWAVVHAGHKWISRSGGEVVYALQADPQERQDVAASTDRAPFPEALAQALGREVVGVWRVGLELGRVPGAVTVRVRYPGGLAAAWSAYDPKGWTEGVTPVVEGGEVVLRRAEGLKAPGELFVRPAGDPHLTEGLEIVIEGRTGTRTLTARPLSGAEDGRRRVVLDDPQRLVSVDLAYAPVPGGKAVRGFDEEVEGALRELGYVE